MENVYHRVLIPPKVISACFQSSSDMDISKSPLLQNKFSVARLAEDFFWVGGSIVASPRWKIGHFGKMLNPCIEWNGDISKAFMLKS